ncbi:keywimysin-related RiPP [Actinomadura fulvescens]
MHTYERPTLTPAGSFFRKTGLVGRPPRDSLGGRQAL